MIELAKQRYEVAIQYINASGIMPTDWMPSFEELKNIAETAEDRDKKGATTCTCIKKI